jgi:hypothetical protein
MAKLKVNLGAWTTRHFQNRFLQIYFSIQGYFVKFYKDKRTNIIPGLQQVIQHDFLKNHHFNSGYFMISYDISTHQNSWLRNSGLKTEFNFNNRYIYQYIVKHKTIKLRLFMEITFLFWELKNTEKIFGKMHVGIYLEM